MKNRDAYIVYLLLEGLFALFFSIVVTVDLVYQVEIVHLNPLQLVLAGTTLEVTTFLCQVPTGVVADVFSRRFSIIIGIFLSGLAPIVEGSFPRFEAILLTEVLWGFGLAFISGAEEAWIAGEVGEENVGRVFMRGSQIGQIGALVGAAISIGLAGIRLNLPIILGGVMFLVLGIFLLFLMPEHNFQRVPRTERSSWRSLGQTLLNGGRVVRGSPLLLTILGVALFYGLYSEGFDRLWTAHLLADITLPAFGPFKPVVWFGIIRGGVMLLSIAATEIVRRRFDTGDNVVAARLLLVLNIVQIVTLITFALAGNFVLALFTYWAFAAVRSMVNPIYAAWLTQNTNPQVRATVISLSGQIDAAGQIAGGPFVGVIGTVVSIRIALVTAGAMLSPVLLLLVRAIRLGRKQP